MKLKIWLKKYGWWLALLAFIFVFHSNHVFNSDEGVVLTGAWNIYNGRVIYKDFFALVTPGIYYLIAWLWQISGPSYLAASILSILAVFFSAVGIYRISRLIGGRAHFIPPLFFILTFIAWPIITYYSFNLFFLVWSTFYFLKAISQGQTRHVLIAGLLAALATLFLQNKGLIFIMASALCLLILLINTKERQYRQWMFLYVVFSLAPLLILLFFWSSTLLYDNLIAFPLFHYSAVIHTPLYLWEILLIVLFFFASFLYKRADKKIMILLCLQLALLISARSLPDWFHIGLAIFPLYTLWPLLLEKILSFPGPSRIFFLGAMAILVFPLLSPSFPKMKQRPLRMGINQPIFGQIEKYCRDSKYIYAGPFIPNIYFESRKSNPTPFDWLITNHHTPEQFLLARQSLESAKPACVVFSPLFVGKYNYDFNNPADNYIATNYETIWSDQNFLLLKLKPSRGFREFFNPTF